MPYTSWNQPDIGGLNDNLVAAITASSGATWPVGSTCTTYAIEGTDPADLQNNINTALALLAVRLFSIALGGLNPADPGKTFALITVIA